MWETHHQAGKDSLEGRSLQGKGLYIARACTEKLNTSFTGFATERRVTRACLAQQQLQKTVLSATERRAWHGLMKRNEVDMVATAGICLLHQPTA